MISLLVSLKHVQLRPIQLKLITNQVSTQMIPCFEISTLVSQKEVKEDNHILVQEPFQGHYR
jgi:hypothetical protein